MGALDKRIFSGVAIVSALLFVVSAVLLLSNGSDVSSDSNGAALYLVAASGVLTIIYSFSLISDRSSFVRTVSGIMTALAGLAFIAAAFAGESTGMVLALASIIAAVAIISDMLALWVTRVYGAMYVSAVLAALVLAMGVLHFINGAKGGYHVVTLVTFAVWLALSAYVSGFVKVESLVHTREIKEDSVTKKAEKPMAKNTKATKKAKKPEKKAEPVPEEKPKEVPKEAPKEVPKEPEKKVEEKPAEKVEEKPRVKPVELPKKPAPAEPEKKAEPVPEKKVEEKPAEAPKEAAKLAPKSSMDFLNKLKSSKDANNEVSRSHVNKVEEKPKEVPVPAEPAKPAEPVEEAPVAEEPVVEVPAEPQVAEEAVVEEAVVEPEEIAEPVEEVPVEEPVEVVEEVPEVTEEPVIEEAVEIEEPVEEPVSEEPAEIPVEDAPAEIPEEIPAEEPAEEVAVEEPVIEEVVEEPAAEPVEEPVEEVPAEEPVIEETVVEEVAEPEPAAAPVAEPAQEPAAEPESAEEEIGEDIYTDYSPEALVRRAAHNKGLRCRRGYGPHEIPVAFVNGKVAVYVTETGEREPVDDELEADGWSVLRYSFDQVTDGKAQGEEISALVKSNIRASKASSKKSKKAKK